MGVLKSTRTRLLDSLKKEGVDLDEILALVTRGFSQKEGVDLVEGFASIVEVLRCMGEIPMFTVCWRPCVGCCLHYSLVFQDG
jgi:hypothetical protein